MNQSQNPFQKTNLADLLSRLAVSVFSILLAALYGAIAAGQILGFLGLYRPAAALGLSLLLAAAAAFFTLRENPRFYSFLPDSERLPEARPLRYSWAAAGLLLGSLLVLLPLARWPDSPFGRSLTWDAGAYHFPKAVELFRSGSAWDLSVAYGDYPFGYESLLSLGYTLTGNEALFGFFHLLFVLFFVLAFWLLAGRYSRLPGGLLVFLAFGLLAGGMVISTTRPWLIAGYAATVGKNDFLLGAAVLAVILFSPAGARRNQGLYHLPGLALASMIALSVKPNGALIVIPAWLLTLYCVWKPASGKKFSAALPGLALAGLAAVPGGLWALRNLIVLGTVFTPAARHLQAESIASNLLNPFLYSFNFPFLLLLAVTAITLLSLLGLRWLKSLSPGIAGVQALLFLTFLITPATAFHRLLDVPSHIAWRFGVALLAFSFLAGLLWIEPLLLRLYGAAQAPPRLKPAIAAVWLITLLLAWRGGWAAAHEPGNRWILRDQFSEPAGMDGYWSAYDYVQKNIRHAVIHIENGLAYYLYGPGYTNTPTKLQYPLEMEDKVVQPTPDYFVIFSTDWESQLKGAEEGETPPGPGGGQFPPSLDSEDWLVDWDLIYDDGQGRVYRKR